ncbi:S8 family serine peptidase [bacterium]|nr:S8 family serine peptidase [bacterium]
MKSIISIALFVSLGIAAEPYWVYFKDKIQNTAPGIMRVLPETGMRRTASALGFQYAEEDLPLNPLYIRLLEISGARIRTRSRWLNAVSVETDSLLLPGLRNMSFVRSLEPVACTQLNISQPDDTKIQKKESIDSAFFGPTYHQLALLNIPAVHNLGIFGNGVKIGFLDTGLHKKHPVFNTLKLGAEHDFITGDDIVVWSESEGSYESFIHNYEIVQQPEIHGQWLLFISDSTPENSQSARVLFASRRTSSGWSDPIPLTPAVLSDRQGVVRSYAASGDSSLVLLWEAGSAGSDYGLTARDLRWAVLNYEGQAFGKSLLDTDSRNPFILTRNDTTFLFYVKNDGNVYFNKAVRTGTSLAWQLSLQVISPGGILDQPKASLSGDTIIVSALDLTQGRLFLARSLNAGASFTAISSPASGRVVAFDMVNNNLLCAEISSGEYNLVSYETDGAGTSWTSYKHPVPFAVIDNVDLIDDEGALKAVFESAGQVFMTKRNSQANWDAPSPLSPDGFSNLPSAFSNSGNLEIVWLERGDGDTDYDPLEDGIDVNNYTHPAHGSRTAALAVGYQGSRYIGASPAAELYVAKTEKHVNKYGLTYEIQSEEDIWIEGLEWLEREGVDIVNSSLAYGEWYEYSERNGLTSPASRAATMAAERGVLVVNAAGNVKSASPYIIPPADAKGILTVGGVDTLGSWWPQTPSSMGSAVGPTSDGRLKPELVAPASGVYVINIDDSLSLYFYNSGTSYAAPLISGTAALMLEAHPEYRGNPDTIISLLERSATMYASPNDTLGYGIPDAYRAIEPLPDTADTFSRNEFLAPYPNPFYAAASARVYFPFRLNKASTFVKIRIYTLNGELVIEKELEPLEPNDFKEIGVGVYTTQTELDNMGAFWDGLTPKGMPAASGLYLAVLHTSTDAHTAKFVLLR